MDPEDVMNSVVDSEGNNVGAEAQGSRSDDVALQARASKQSMKRLKSMLERHPMREMEEFSVLVSTAFRPVTLLS